MRDIDLFDITMGDCTPLPIGDFDLEKGLQALFEKNLETLLGVRFLASEFSTTHRGRIDTLGLDENGYPVILEYKKDRSGNVINQGLFYLDWLIDHRGDFELLVQRHLGAEAAKTIEWSAPRLICVAADFNRYDSYAINQMSRSIDLVRYALFDRRLLMLELVGGSSPDRKIAKPTTATQAPETPLKRGSETTIRDSLANASPDLTLLFREIEDHLLSLGDDVSKTTLRFYFAFKRIKNFCCAEVKPQLDLIRLYLKVDPSTVDIDDNFARDVSRIGHFGTGDLELTLRSPKDFERAKPLIRMSYDAS